MGRQHIVEEIIAAKNQDNVQQISATTSKKSMTLPARMQPPSDFNEESITNLNCQAPPICNNGTGSIGRVENSKKGFSFKLKTYKHLKDIINYCIDMSCLGVNYGRVIKIHISIHKVPS